MTIIFQRRTVFHGNSSGSAVTSRCLGTEPGGRVGITTATYSGGSGSTGFKYRPGDILSEISLQETTGLYLKSAQERVSWKVVIKRAEVHKGCSAR
jgi:hypothetical protein